MNIRKAAIKDIDEIMKLIKDAVHDMQRRGVDQWDDIYPNREVIEEDVESGNLFVYDDDIIKGIIVLNEYQDEEYNAVDWKYRKTRILVIHRLCISTKYQSAGLARAMVRFAEDYARKNKYEAIRLDTFIDNERACKLYQGEGYKGGRQG
jgi:Acetyltransferase (GNAT) family.